MLIDTPFIQDPTITRKIVISGSTSFTGSISIQPSDLSAQANAVYLTLDTNTGKLGKSNFIVITTSGTAGTAGSSGTSATAGTSGLTGYPGSSGTSGVSVLHTGSTYPITASWAITSSYTLNGGTQLYTGSTYPITASWAVTASYALNGNAAGSQLYTGSTYPITASWALNANRSLTASYVSSSQFIFLTDLIVSLSGGKTFGRFVSGSTIPSAGKTPAEVISLAVVEPITPTANLTSPTTIAFNQTAINNVLNTSYVIKSLNSTVSSAKLQWRRGDVGSWTTLTTSTTNPNTFTHTLTDTNFNTNSFNYRYLVVDTLSAGVTASLNITPNSYVQPTALLTVVGSNLSGNDTNTLRERGNTATILSGTIGRNSQNVSLISYSVQFNINNGSWTNVPGLGNIPISGASAVIPSTSHTPTSSGTTSVGYRVSVADDYATSVPDTVYITFLYSIFYGPSATAPTNSTGVRALGTAIFTTGQNPYVLDTGNTDSIFTSAMPSSLFIAEVLDIDALNANITNNYIKSTFNIDDAGGNPVSYNVYTLTNAIPYASNHRHITSRY